MGGLFSSGIPITQSGYKLLYKIFRWSPPPPEFVPAPADPRGKFAPGMIPSKNLSYRTYNQLVVSTTSTANVLSEQVGNPLGGGLVSLVVQSTALPDVAFGIGVARSAVILFEGHDVIDLPTDNLAFEDGILTLPGNPFRLIYAGSTPLVPTNDIKGIAYWTSLAYHGLLDGNTIAGSTITDDAPFDVRAAKTPQGAKFVDTASNKVRIQGEKPKFVSYIEIDKPIFRDVVMSKSSVQAFGFNNPVTGFLLDSTALLGQPETYVLRFAYMNVSRDPKIPKFQWRLSESMGIKPDNIAPTPTDVAGLLTSTEKIELSLSIASSHYAYNLSDLDSKDTTENNDYGSYKPAKTAYNIAYAKLKSRANNKYFDKNFSAIIFEQATGSGQGAGLTTALAVAPFGTNGQAFSGNLATEFMYTSPTVVANSSGKARIGTEYNGQIFGGRFLGGASDFWLLARTVENKSGMSCAYDPCVKNAYLYDVVPITVGSNATERTLDDTRWAIGFEKRPSQSNGMLLGEYPFRSSGAAILLPEQVQIDASISIDGIELPDQKFPTTLLCGTGPSSVDVAKLFDNAQLDGVPTFEASFISAPEGSVLLGIPPLRFAGFAPGGGLTNVTEIFGVGVGDVILAAMPPLASASKDNSTNQIAAIETLKWPMPISNTSAAMDCTTGHFFLAFENGDRIDLAFRTSYNLPFGIIRDAILRIPDSEDVQNNRRARRSDTSQKRGTSDASDLPPAGLPFLVTDGTVKILYLFYSYKGKLLCKKIAYELLIPSQSSSNNQYAAQEKDIISKLHAITPSLVYDSSSTAPSSQGQNQSQSLVADIKAGAIRIVEDPTTAPPAKGETRSLDQYSVVLDKQGYLFAFIQSGGKILVRRSTDLGDGWTRILPSGFSFFPGGSIGDLEAPFALYDNVQDTILLFYVMNGALLFQKLPASDLRDDPDEVASALAGLVPKVLFGTVTKQLLDHGVTPSPSVIGGVPSDGKAILAQRMAGYITSTGQYRIFFRDSDNLLLSLISSNSGEEWLSETEYEENRAGQLDSLQFFDSPDSFKQSIPSGDNG